MACSGKTGDEPRALPWAAMKQAVGLKTAGGPTRPRPHAATGTYSSIPSGIGLSGTELQVTQAGLSLRTAMPRFDRRLRRFNAEAQRFAEIRRGLFFSAFLCALRISALKYPKVADQIQRAGDRIMAEQNHGDEKRPQMAASLGIAAEDSALS